MERIYHFEKWSLIRGRIHVDMDLVEKYRDRAKVAQWWLGEQVLQSSQARMPLSTGSVRQRSRARPQRGHMADASSVQDGGRRVVFPGPYARFHYMGHVMVDPMTGSPWARKGVKKVVTSRRLTWSQPGAVPHWFEEAKAQDGGAWARGVQRILTTGRRP